MRNRGIYDGNAVEILVRRHNGEDMYNEAILISDTELRQLKVPAVIIGQRVVQAINNLHFDMGVDIAVSAQV